MRSVNNNIINAIGNTPLVELKKIVPPGIARIVAKLESANPTGSMKDRMAKTVIEAAETKGLIKKGTTIVEYTAGTTGISLAFVCAALGYDFHAVFSDAFSNEKRITMRSFGATITDVPSDNKKITEKLIKEMIETSRVLCEQPDHWWADQLNNHDAETGYYPLGDEMWEQTNGKLDAFVHSVSTAHSIHGVTKSLLKHNGKTWQWLGLPESHHIGKINLHPTDNNIAWVAVLGHLYSANKERGIYKTIDGGKTWKQTLYVDDNTGAADMDINPKNPDELYAAMWYRTRRAWNFEEGGKTSGIYKSTDGGNTWKLTTAVGSGFPTGNGLGRIGVAVFAANPTIIYATLDNQDHRPDTAKKKNDTSYVLKDFRELNKENFLLLDNNKLDSFLADNNFPEKYKATVVKDLVKNDKVKPTAVYEYLFDANTALFETPIIGCEVYRSDDAGLSWKKVNTKGLNLYNTYGYYFGKISVSNTNENKVVISGFNLMLSEDGGKTFKSTDKSATHADWHGCWIDPNKDSHWIAGNDGGCNITYDDGKHWFKANTPSVGQFYNIAVDDAKPYNIYGGLQDNGTWFGPSTARDNDQWNFEGVYPWKNMGGGDGMQVQVDTRDNKTLYAGSQFGFYGRRNTDGGRGVSLYPRNDLGEPKFRYNWQTPIWLSRHNQDIFYYGTNRFHRSLQKGEKLEPLSGDLTNGGKEGDIPFGTSTTLVESPLKFGLIYIGTDDGNIQVSKDGGYTWTKISGSLPKTVQGMYVSRVTPSAFKEGRVYATLNAYRNDNFGAYLFMSEDYGTTWTQLGNDLPAEPLNVVKEDPKKENIIYVGSDNGLYITFNKGKTFMTLDNSLPRVPVHDITIQQRENELVVGTHGRSIYITKLDAVHKAYDKMMGEK